MVESGIIGLLGNEGELHKLQINLNGYCLKLERFKNE